MVPQEVGGAVQGAQDDIVEGMEEEGSGKTGDADTRQNYVCSMLWVRQFGHVQYKWLIYVFDFFDLCNLPKWVLITSYIYIYLLITKKNLLAALVDYKLGYRYVTELGNTSLTISTNHHVMSYI